MTGMARALYHALSEDDDPCTLGTLLLCDACLRIEMADIKIKAFIPLTRSDVRCLLANQRVGHHLDCGLCGTWLAEAPCATT